MHNIRAKLFAAVDLRSRRLKGVLVFNILLACVSLSIPGASIETNQYWCPLSDINNPGDTNVWASPAGCGSVAYSYQIMSNELTVAQYTNNQTGTGNMPATNISFYDAMCFADLLTTNAAIVFTTNVTIRKTDGSVSSTNFFFINHFKEAVYCKTNGASLIDLPMHANLVQSHNYVFPPPDADWLTNNLSTNLEYILDWNLTDWSSWPPPITTNYVYLIPNEDEWYKAAYYCPTQTYEHGAEYYFRYPGNSLNISTNDFNYGGGSNWVSIVGSRAGRSSYGTCDQGGNVWEWIEPNTNMPGTPAGCAIIRGGSYFSRNARDLSSSCREFHVAHNGVAGIGFRLVRIPQN